MADLQDDPHEGPGAVTAPADPPAVPPVPVEAAAELPSQADTTEPADPADEAASAAVAEAEAITAVAADAAATVDAAVRALLAGHPVVDGHNSLPRMLRLTPHHDLETSENSVDTDIPRLRAGGVGAQFWSLLPPQDADGLPAAEDVVAETLDQLDIARDLVRSYPDSLLLALGPDELSDARNRGRIASFLGPVSGRTLTGSLGPLRAFHALGVRSLAPAGAAWAEPALTAFGHEAVREMNRLAILLDLAGCTPEAARRIIAASKAPVVVSHAGAAALHPHPRNVPDEVLAALGAAKGLFMVSFEPELLGAGEVTLATVADHLDHARAVAGPHSVGLGAAFGTDPFTPRVAGLEDPAGYPRLLAELCTRGWSEADLTLLTWSNAQRVLRDAEFTARAAQHRRSGPSA
ncbi:dipeptidase [Streptomyces sp. NPDC089919]|uniref:dipeptidase n=1 Tax=Streptomyces sp. NPDC089919 TaxID=3155188 RepID=UPI003443CEB7